MKQAKWGFWALALSLIFNAKIASALTLDQYLSQVRTQNKAAVAAREMVVGSEFRLRQAEVGFTPELFAEFQLRDDKRETIQPAFMGTRTEGEDWRVGLQQQTNFGLAGRVFFQRSHTQIYQSALPLPDYVEPALGLELTQSLLRNGFGAQTRAEYQTIVSERRIEHLRAKLDFKNILVDAENVYWSLSSLNEIVKLQKENVVRATKLRDRMRSQARVRLLDDVDALQSQAALESRELELETSLAEQAELVRTFNTLRGVDEDIVENLDSLPSGDLKLAEKVRGLKLTREDLLIVAEQAKYQAAGAQAGGSKLLPQLDLFANYTTYGKDLQSSRALDEMDNFDHPAWTVGVRFSMPLDVMLLRELRKGFKNQGEAAKNLSEHSEFSAQRIWKSLLKQHDEIRQQFERASGLERVQTELVKKQQSRMRAGRSTTFETIGFEQNLALTQIQRVRAQLALLRLHNTVKTFEEIK